MELIDKQKAKKAFVDLPPELDALTVQKAIEAIGIVKAEEVVQVKHGWWIDNGWDGDFYWRIDGKGNCWKVISCSICGGNLCGNSKTNYCPHCGAKMDVENSVDNVEKG